MQEMIDPQFAVSSFHAANPAESDVDHLLRASDGKVFVIGRNDCSLRLAGARNISGLVDDFSSEHEWEGLPIFRMNDLPRGAIVINCSTSISPISVAKRVGSIEGVRCVPYADLCRIPLEGIGLPDFAVKAREDFAEHGSLFSWIFSRLADPISKETFNKVMAYRLTADYSYMQGFSVRLHDQYFDELVPAVPNLVFADCGGYDGDTTEQFVLRYPDYRLVHLFEPSLSNIDKARQRLQNARDIEFHPLGLSDAPGTLFFNPDAASASAISSSGSVQIEVTTLDLFVTNPVSFIKMDLEGWELRALKGAENHVRSHSPILAIAVYHDVSDFWRIPDYVLSINPNYNVYIRHYTEGWSETVMYFVPRHLSEPSGA